jgi:hypothetical protein
MTIPANPYPDVPLPAGAQWNGDWEDIHSVPWRVIQPPW